MATWIVVLVVGGTLSLMAARLLQLSQGWNGNLLSLSSRIASGPVVLEQIQSLQRLETCRYQGQVIVEGEQSGKLPLWLAGDRMLFVGRGEVVAGIDLSRLQSGDVQVNGDRLMIRIPAPQILHTRLDTAQSEVYERKTGVLTGPDRHLETRVRQEAEAKIQQAALQHGVLDRAGQSAREVLSEQGRLLGFREVSFL